MGKMSDQELFKYIHNQSYNCCYCAKLKKKVLENGLEEIDKYDDMICGGIEDMFIRRGRW